MDASRVLCPAKRRYVKSESSWISCCCHHLLFNLAVPPIVATLELHLMRWISKGAPIEPMRHSPHQLISGRARAQTKVPHATLRGQKGLQGGWDPSLRRRLAATPPGRSRIHLGLVCTSRQSSRLHALISLSERWPSAPRRFRGIATR